MSRLWSSPLVLAAVISAACGSAKGASSADKAIDPAAVPVSTATAVERPITRFIRVTGTLAAEEQADVAAETQGRVVATPVERGTRVAMGADLIRIAAAEASASAAEAQANAAQIESRLGIAGGAAFEVDRVPEVANARANLTLAEGDYERAKMLVDKKLLSQAEFDQRSAQAEVARRQFDIARNGAVQQYQALLGARARVSMAQKALADTVVRAPFTGVVGERLVSVGDYVTRGTKVASVMRTNPMRLELTVPQQFSPEVRVGRAVSLEVDTAPGKTFVGQVRYVSPALQTDSRTLIVEAVVANPDGSLKPGSFATAQIEQAENT
ncbi:MAG TPA: efflux RND transporter periplasmic adaptor subunit, partial [Vicinamibacterales bacterium]|nr:efflux RND transporter periplasmic adaptor subunit [Vicinamibacterales bacterium]